MYRNQIAAASSCAAVILALVSGCASYEVIDSQSPELAVHQLLIGDKVRIGTTDGNEVRFTVTSLEDDAVVGKNARVQIDDIAYISVKPRPDGTLPESVEGAIMLIGFALGLSLLASLGL